MIVNANTIFPQIKTTRNDYLQRFKTVEQRFFEKVNKNGNIMPHTPYLGKCWEWAGGKRDGEYGQFKFCKKSQFAHRVSWILHFGEIPNGLCVLHRCDNPICVNPEHLWIGTEMENRIDMESKGRRNCGRGNNHASITHPEKIPKGDNHYIRKNPEKVLRGELAPWSKLNNSKIADIFERIKNGESGIDIARFHNVSTAQISRIKNGTRWSHIKF